MDAAGPRSGHGFGHVHYTKAHPRVRLQVRHITVQPGPAGVLAALPRARDAREAENQALHPTHQKGHHQTQQLRQQQLRPAPQVRRPQQEAAAGGRTTGRLGGTSGTGGSLYHLCNARSVGCTACHSIA